MTSFQAKTDWERPRKRKKKIVVPISSYPTKNREFQKKSKKFKNIIMASCQAKTGRDQLRKKKKIYNSDQLLPDQEQKIPKKQQKNSKN